GRAIADITAKYGEPITVLDNSMVLIPTAKPSAWSAIHDPANYVYMPSGQRRTFIRETAGRLGRMGWLVVDRWLRDHSLIDDLESAYQRVEMRDYGTYYALRYRPLAGCAENPRCRALGGLPGERQQVSGLDAALPGPGTGDPEPRARGGLHGRGQGAEAQPVVQRIGVLDAADLDQLEAGLADQCREAPTAEELQMLDVDDRRSPAQ